jgi:hypothetical protein
VLDPDGKNIEAVLRRRSQFTPEPARCRARLHRIDKLDHSLMNVFTSGALECSDVKPAVPGVFRASIVIVLHFRHVGP